MITHSLEKASMRRNFAATFGHLAKSVQSPSSRGMKLSVCNIGHSQGSFSNTPMGCTPDGLFVNSVNTYKLLRFGVEPATRTYVLTIAVTSFLHIPIVQSNYQYYKLRGTKGNRNPDPIFFRDVLYHLSYGAVASFQKLSNKYINDF